MKIAMITGASSGLGREFARQLDRQEQLDEIWAIARREERLRELAGQVTARLRPLPLDLTDPESIQTLSDLLQAEGPQVQVLINAAGFGKIGSYADVSIQDNARMIALNCRAAVSVTQAVLPYMGPGSHILEICSTAGFQPFPYLSVYAASKAFLYRYSRALRVELYPRRVWVTAVCPYWVKDTEFIGKARDTRDSSYIRGFPLTSRQDRVVRRALGDASLGLAVSTPGPVCFFHRIAAKFIPSGVMMALWELIRRL